VNKERRPPPYEYAKTHHAEDELYPGEATESGSGLCLCHKTCVA
jgi:hypothetical protein